MLALWIIYFFIIHKGKIFYYKIELLLSDILFQYAKCYQIIKKIHTFLSPGRTD